MRARNLSTLLKQNSLKSKSLYQLPMANLNHIKNMLDENLRYDIEQVSQQPLIERTDRIYKPTYTLEMNRKAEVLVYSCDPFKHSVIYFKYPYVLYEACAPLLLFNFLFNPFDLPWYYNNVGIFMIYGTWIPRMWYLRGLQYRI